MESLSEKVYECTLAVEAHMIVDLLARAGLSARIDGEYLAGAGGELPLGSTIKVRVTPRDAAEARQVIDEWEKLQPAAAPPPVARPRWRSPLWFATGAACGFAAAFAMMQSNAVRCPDDHERRGVFEYTDAAGASRGGLSSPRHWLPL